MSCGKDLSDALLKVFYGASDKRKKA